MLNQYDAFISYARDDDILCDHAVRHFKHILKQRFEAEIRRRLDMPRNAEASIFMDKTGLPANGALSAELEAALATSIFLIIFIGVSYPRSEWCSRELKTFMAKFNGCRRRALERTFVIVLEKNAVPQAWGDELEKPQRPIYEEFFDDVTGRMIPFILEGPDGEAYPSPRFTSRLRKVVETMAERAIAATNTQ